MHNFVKRDLQTSGLGGLRHNTVVVAWPDEWAESHELSVCQRFVSTLRAADAADCAILVPKNVKTFPSSHVKVRLKALFEIFVVTVCCRLLIIWRFL